MQKKKRDTARSLAIEIAHIAHRDNAEDIIILDLRGVSPVTDYFVIATGSSDRQIRTIADELVEHGRSVGQPVWNVAGRDTADWIVVDFVDIVVHLFEASRRDYYDLELIWGQTSHVKWQETGHSATSSDSPE